MKDTKNFINEKETSNCCKTKVIFRQTPKAKGVTLAKDSGGYFCYTHRSSSKRYKTIAAIPKSVIETVESTG